MTDKQWTPEREADAEARCEVATEGPWISSDKYYHTPSLVKRRWGDDQVLAAFYQRRGKSYEQSNADANFTAHARTDLLDAIRNGRRLREQLIEEWTHRPLKCPCSPRQLDLTAEPAPWQECKCGLNEALYGGGGA